MKPIHKRLYTVLPRPAIASSSCSSASSPISRVRSNSVSSSRTLYAVNPTLSFYDSPPPLPASRPSNSNLITSTRLAVEVKPEADTQHYSPNTPQTHNHSAGPPPYSLALTSTHSESASHIPSSHQNPFFPYQSFVPIFHHDASPAGAVTSESQQKRHRTWYHLDVGAYGIPKRSLTGCVAGRDGHGKLAFAEGSLYPGEELEGLERAVQVGEDAYFVRDNAMGVADGVGGWSKGRRNAMASATELSPSALFARRLMHYCSEEVEAVSSADGPEPSMSDVDSDIDAADLYTDLEDSLDELEEGLDVLMILEKAFEKTMRVHVTRADSRSPASERSGTENSPLPPDAPVQHVASAVQTPEPLSPPKPRAQGSSTALLAILEHPSTRHARAKRQSMLFNPQCTPIEVPRADLHSGAILRIAHLGDCMGMLIRGEQIVWRTEEMWWNFNTPVQLGPASPSRPQDARVFALPVEADDILILASDGLSDNLWDEDVLDEVVRFRRPYLTSGAWFARAPSAVGGVFARRTLAAMLSEALCSRARRASERRGRDAAAEAETEVPFARRARELGRTFHGGKPDDISVLVAVVSPTL